MGAGIAQLSATGSRASFGIFFDRCSRPSNQTRVDILSRAGTVPGAAEVGSHRLCDGAFVARRAVRSGMARAGGAPANPLGVVLRRPGRAARAAEAAAGLERGRRFVHLAGHDLVPLGPVPAHGAADGCVVCGVPLCGLG